MKSWFHILLESQDLECFPHGPKWSSHLEAIPMFLDSMCRQIEKYLWPLLLQWHILSNQLDHCDAPRVFLLIVGIHDHCHSLRRGECCCHWWGSKMVARWCLLANLECCIGLGWVLQFSVYCFHHIHPPLKQNIPLKWKTVFFCVREMKPIF